jgi:hypothetical protein
MAGIPNTRVAKAADCTAEWVGRCLLGYNRPPERLRKVIADLLGKPEGELFYDWDDEPAGARS